MFKKIRENRFIRYIYSQFKYFIDTCRLVNPYRKYLFLKSVGLMPENYLIETTNICNLNCRLCSNNDMIRKKENMSLTNFKSILTEISPFAKHIGFDLGGEPLINTHTLDMVKLSTELNIHTALTTNAHFLTETNVNNIFDSGLKKLVISLGGVTKRTYDFYHFGGNFDLAKKI